MHEVRLRDGVTIFPGFRCGEDYQLPLCSCSVALLGEQSTGGLCYCKGSLLLVWISQACSCGSSG